MGKLNSPGARTQGESNLGQEGLRDRNSPTCTLSQNGYGEGLILKFALKKKAGRRGGKRMQKETVIAKIRSRFSENHSTGRWRESWEEGGGREDINVSAKMLTFRELRVVRGLCIEAYV